MKLFLLCLLPVMALVTTPSDCNKRSAATHCFKGRLEVKSMCLHYVIKLVEGTTGAVNTVPAWTDPESNKTYQNVFTVSNFCSFPDTLKQGQEFYFTIIPEVTNSCIRCLAYKEVPKAQNNIAVTNTGCK